MSAARARDVERDGTPPPAVAAAVLAVLAVLLAAWTVAAVAETAARASTASTPVQAVVVDERVEERVVGDRRGSRPAPFRIVVVELPDGTRADLRSEELAVGAEVTVHRDDAGRVFARPPAAPGLLEWSLCTALAASSVLLAVASLRAAVRARRR